MPRVNADLLAFNRGLISRLSLARVDIDRTRLSAAKMENWIPKTQGAMRIRPGTKYLGSSYGDTGATWIDFVAATDDTALLEVTGGENDTGSGRMRVWIDDALIAITTRMTGTGQMTGVNSDTGPWNDDSANGGTINFGDTGMVLNANGYGALAKATQKVTLGDTGDEDTEFFLDIEVDRGPVTFRCGSDTGLDDFVSESELRTGHHLLAFTPNDTGGFHLTFQTAAVVDRIVGGLSFGDTGTMEVISPWHYSDIGKLRWAQSADVVFTACDGYKQRRIERRGTGRSWSIVEYQSDNGPFLPKTADVRLKVAQTYGNTTLTADKPFFKSTHVGALFYLFHENWEGYKYPLAGEDVYTIPALRLTGVNNGTPNDRTFAYQVNGTFTATIHLQVSSDSDEDGFNIESVDGNSATQTITTSGSHTYTSRDSQDNLIEWIRWGIFPGDYTSGIPIINVTDYPGNGSYGIVRVTEYTSTTVVNCEVLRPPVNTGYTSNWREGAWSDAQRWPSSVRLYEGRLWWFGKTYLWASVSDDYENFDDTTEGDSRPIVRTLGEGPVDSVSDAIGLGRLLIGTTGRYLAARSTSFDEPLTADSIQIKPITTNGAADLRAIQVDTKGVYVHNSGSRAFLLNYNVDAQDYIATELTELNPDILLPGVIDVGVQRQPDTRLHFVRSDGKVVLFTYEEEGQVLCWSLWSSDTGNGSAVERVTVLPGTTEDKVYYHVKRTANGTTKRYLEKWAMETESVGDTGLSFLADSAVSFSKDTGTTIAVDHLIGRKVAVWANDTGCEAGTDDGHDLSYDTGTLGQSQRLYTVDTGGDIQIDYHHKHGVVGLPYAADWQSTKLAYAAAGGTALAQLKRVDKIAFVLADAHNNGLFFGRDFSNLDPLPRVSDEGATVDSDKIFDDFDQMSMPFPGLWNSDSRICLRALAPRPITVLAAVPTVGTNDKI